MKMWAILGMALLALGRAAAVVEVADWDAQEKLPEPRTAAFGGTLPDGRMISAGGKNSKELWTDEIFVRASNVWSRVGRLPLVLTDGVSARTEKGVVCVGARVTDGEKGTAAVFLIGPDLTVEALPDFPADPQGGAAAADGSCVYVSSGRRFWRLDLDRPGAGWERLPSVPGPGNRKSPVAAVLRGANGRFLAVFGGVSPDRKRDLRELGDGWGLSLEPADGTNRANWFKLAAPTGFSAVGASFLALGPYEALLVGGCGLAKGGGAEGEQGPRTVLAYDARANAWRACGAFTSDDAPRCAAAAGVRRLGAAGAREVVLAGGAYAGRPSATVSVLRVTGVAEPAADGWMVGDIRLIVLSLLVAVLFVAALLLWQVRRKDP